MKYYYDVVQGTDEWFKIRLGKFTASAGQKLLMSKNTKGYKNLIWDVVYERLYDKRSDEDVNTYWMQRGLELEGQARRNFEFQTFYKVCQVGFVELNEYAGCSPDGLIGQDALVEIKCVKHNTMFDAIISNNIEKDIYYAQCQYQMFITNRDINYLYYYHPEIGNKIKEIKRDEKYINQIQDELEIANETVDNIIKKLISNSDKNKLQKGEN